MVGKCKENVIWNRGDTQMDPLRRAERYDAGTDIKNHKVKKQEHTTFRHGKKNSNSESKQKINNKHVETIKPKAVEMKREKKVDDEIDKRICIIHIFVWDTLQTMFSL